MSRKLWECDLKIENRSLRALFEDAGDNGLVLLSVTSRATGKLITDFGLAQKVMILAENEYIQEHEARKEYFEDLRREERLLGEE